MALDLDKPWVELPWVVVDLETTGVDPKRAQPVEVACVRFEGGVVTDKFVTLVKPFERIPEAATAIHGITNDMVSEYHSLPAYAGFIANVARDALPVAYNESYDRRIFHRFLEGSDCPAFAMSHWVCPLTIVRDVERVTEGKGWYKLANTCKRWGIDTAPAHRAEGDATATGQLLWRMSERGKIKSCSAAKLLAHQVKRAEAHEAARAW
jgi:DNA polymerase III subunit epsilon